MSAYISGSAFTIHSKQTSVQTGTNQEGPSGTSYVSLFGREQSIDTNGNVSSNPAGKNNVHGSSKSRFSFNGFKLIRAVLLILIMVVALSFGAIMQTFAQSGTTERQSADQAAARSNSVVALHGDTWWNIADEHAPEGTDVRVYLRKLYKANNVKPTAVLKAGDVIKLP